jgi:hypothetical protein
MNVLYGRIEVWMFAWYSLMALYLKNPFEVEGFIDSMFELHDATSATSRQQSCSSSKSFHKEN